MSSKEEAVYGLKYAYISLNNSNYKKLRFDCKNVEKYCDQEKDFHSDCILFEKSELDKLYDTSPAYVDIDPLDVLRPYGEGYTGYTGY